MLSVLVAEHAESASQSLLLTGERVGGDTEAIPSICSRESLFFLPEEYDRLIDQEREGVNE